MRRFALGVVAGFLLAPTVAGASILEPAPLSGVPFHPTGTVHGFMPDGCDVAREIRAEQTRDRRGYRPQVRELVVYRLRCAGEAHRTMVARGPWLDAFVGADTPQR